MFPFPAPLSKHSCLLGGWEVGQAVVAIAVIQAAVVAIQFIETRGREGGNLRAGDGHFSEFLPNWVSIIKVF